jgi:ribosome-associated heat shock protein Hsp15
VKEPKLTTAPVRLDKWLWAARFFKTRSLAVEAIGKNRVDVNGQPAKPSRDLRVGDQLSLREPGLPPRTVQILGLSEIRGPAPVAQTCTPRPRSLAAQAAREARRQASSGAGHRARPPDQRDRRQLADWNRWSASADSSPRRASTDRGFLRRARSP